MTIFSLQDLPKGENYGPVTLWDECIRWGICGPLYPRLLYNYTRCPLHGQTGHCA